MGWKPAEPIRVNVSVPGPATTALLAFGLFACLMVKRRRTVRAACR
jgi:hypothetical protein